MFPCCFSFVQFEATLLFIYIERKKERKEKEQLFRGVYFSYSNRSQRKSHYSVILQGIF